MDTKQDMPEKERMTLYSPDGQQEEVEVGSPRDGELQNLGWSAKKLAPQPASAQGVEGDASVSEDGMVSIPKEKLDKILAVVESQQRDIEMLKYSADTAKMHNWNARNQAARPKYVKIRVFQNHLVLGWATVTNTADYDAETETVNVNQVAELLLDPTAEEKDAGKSIVKKQVPYRMFGQLYETVDAQVIASTTLENGDVQYKVRVLPVTVEGQPSRFPQFAGREFTLPVTFLN